MLAPNTQLFSGTESSWPHAPRTLLLIAIVFLATAAGCLMIDMPMLRVMRDTDPPGDIQRLVDFSEGFGHGLGVGLIILTVAVLANSWKKAVTLATYAYGAGLLCDAVKFIVARHRPYHGVDFEGSLADTFIAWLPWINGVPLDQPTSSFPSAHAATAFGLAIGLTRLYPRGRFIFFFCAILGAVQRLDSYAHYTSDVIAGAGIAFVVASIMACEWTLATIWIRSESGMISCEELTPRPEIAPPEIAPRTDAPPRRCA